MSGGIWRGSTILGLQGVPQDGSEIKSQVLLTQRSTHTFYYNVEPMIWLSLNYAAW